MNILVVENAPSPGDSLAAGLARLGYAVESTAACRSTRGQGREFDAIVVDLASAGRSGWPRQGEFRRLYPRARILVLSSYAAMDESTAGLIRDADEILLKPFDLAGLHAVLQDGGSPSAA